MDDPMYKLTGLQAPRRAWLRRLYGRLTEPEVTEAHSAQSELLRRWRRADDPSAVLDFSSRAAVALLVVLDRHDRASRSTRRKATADEAKTAEISRDRLAAAVTDSQAKKQNSVRPPLKLRKIELRHYHQIIELREQGLSWSSVADFLRRHHRTRITGDYLRKGIFRILQNRAQGAVNDDELQVIEADWQKLRLPEAAGEGGDG